MTPFLDRFLSAKFWFKDKGQIGTIQSCPSKLYFKWLHLPADVA